MKSKRSENPPRFLIWILKTVLDNNISSSALSDIEDVFCEIQENRGRFTAVLWYCMQIISSIPKFTSNKFYWWSVMFINYLKVNLRNFKKQKGYMFINVSGLAVGIACCILILLFIQLELSYDRYHEDYDRIFRVAHSSEADAGGESEPSNTAFLGPHLKENYPQVETSARIYLAGRTTIRKNENIMYETDTDFADPAIFDILKIPFIHGDPSTALNRPGTAVLTEKAAVKYFGDEMPVGKTLQIDTLEYEITGIVKNPPRNTHFKYNILRSMKTIEKEEYDWHFSYVTYIKLVSGIKYKTFEDQIRELTNEYILRETEIKGIKYINFLQPVAEIHLYSNLTWEMEAPGNLMQIYLFSTIAVLILLIACSNFIILSTARSANRSREVGVRKVVGAGRYQLVWQFLGESAMMTFISFAFSLIIVSIVLPWFNSLAGTQFTFRSILNPVMLLSLLGLMAFTSFAGGSYPAFFFSSFKPVTVLSGLIKPSSGKSGLRKGLIIGQFAISVTLLLVTLAVYNQLNFMKKQDLGFKKDRKLVLTVKRGDFTGKNYKSMKSELTSFHNVKSATISSSVPGRWVNKWYTQPTGGEQQFAFWLMCDYDYISEFNLEIIAGRAFQKGLDKTSLNSFSETPLTNVIINETAVKTFKWNSPAEALGKTFWEGNVRVIGVIKDYHHRGLKNSIRPLILVLRPMGYRCITLTVDTEDISGVLSFIKEKNRSWFPDKPLEFFFLDEFFDRQYRSVERTGSIFSTFAFIGICIACFGLFGLTSFVAEQKRKEIGIRKVLGASASNIVILLTKKFLFLITIGAFISWPVSYYLINRWLQDFAYRTGINWWLFAVSWFAVSALTLITVSYQLAKAAATNPVETIKYE